MHFGVVFLLLPLCFCVLVEWIAGAGATGIGVNYIENSGSESAEEFVQLLRSRGIGKIRLHNADSGMLRALGGGSSSSSREDSAIEVIVGVRNNEIVDVGVSLDSARSWVSRNVVPYFPSTNIIAIAVGSEVLTSGEGDSDSLVPFLVPAMKNLYTALSEVGLEKQIKVSAPQSVQVLSSYFPPSSAAFKPDLTGKAMAPLLDFLASSGSYFMLTMYPLDLQDQHVDIEKQLPLDLSAGSGMDDPRTSLRYSNMFDVLIDAVSAAMASLDQHQLNIVVTDAGWSRMEASTGSSSPSAYNANLLGLLSKGLGTPSKPEVGVDTFVRREDLMILPKYEEKSNNYAAAFSSRRMLMGPLEASLDKTVKRRRLAPNKSWCVAKSAGSTEALQTALDWACGPGGANCAQIQAGQSCFLPNNVVSHASYAFNSYYQSKNWASDSCDFGGLAQTTSTDPSTASCLYTSNTSANGTPSTPTGTIVPSAAARLMWDRRRFMLTSLILIFMLRRAFSDSKF